MCLKMPSPQQKRGVHLGLVQCWASVEEGGSTLSRHWVNISCNLGLRLFYANIFKLLKFDNYSPIKSSLFINLNKFVQLKIFHEIFFNRWIHQQILYVFPLLAICWSSVADNGPALNRHQFDVSRLPGCDFVNDIRILIFPHIALNTW